MALITVIVPNYNHARFLHKRLQSILNQSFTDFEVIILDDASTDESREIIETYRYHPQVKAIVLNEQNTGSPFKQWEKGIALANTDWLWIAESDDYCEANFLQSLAPAFQNKMAVLAYTAVKWVNADGELVKSLDAEENRWYEGKEFIKTKMLVKNSLMNAGQVIFRKSFLSNKTEIEWTAMKQCGDYALFCDIASRGMVYCSGQYLAYFVRHPGTVSSTHLHTLKAIEECLQVWKYLYIHSTISAQDVKSAVVAKMQPLITSQSNFSRLFVSDELAAYLNFCREMDIEISTSKLRLISIRDKMKNIVNSSRNRNG